MNRSEVLVAEEPAGVVMLTSTVPVPRGVTALTCVLESTVKLVAATFPNNTAVAPAKPLPVIVTLVPPASGPLRGAIRVMMGARAAADGDVGTLG